MNHQSQGGAWAWWGHEVAAEGKLQSPPWSAGFPRTKSRRPSPHQNRWREGLEVAGRGGMEMCSMFVLGQNIKRSAAMKSATPEMDWYICMQLRQSSSQDIGSSLLFWPDGEAGALPCVFRPEAQCATSVAIFTPGWAAWDTTDRPTTFLAENTAYSM